MNQKWQKINPGIFDETIDSVSHHTKDIVGFIKDASYDDLPDVVVRDAKRLILDTIGCAFGGTDALSTRISKKTAEYLGNKQISTIIGSNEKTSPPLAALVNAKSANALDFDDCFMNVAHFAPQSVMASLGIGESLKSSGKDYILSVVLGYEIAARIALTANWWKVTRNLMLGGAGTIRLVFGTNIFASVVATGKILKLSEEQLLNALGVCGHFAPSLIRSSEAAIEPPTYSDAGYMAKYCDAGWSTFTGIMSAIYAQNGYVTNHHTLDGGGGYIKVMGGAFANPDLITNNLSRKQKHWYISDSAIKTYPCCKYIQTPLCLFLEIIEENGLQLEKIEKVIVHFRPSHAIGFSDQSIHIMKGIPCTHNIPYNMAMGAFKIPPNKMWHSEENTKNPKIQAFMKKIFVVPSGKASLVGVDDIQEFGFPKKIFSKVDVFYNGRKFTKSRDKVKGDPWWKETFLSDEDLAKKFEILSREILNRKKGEEVIDKIMNLEKVKDISMITELLTER